VPLQKIKEKEAMISNPEFEEWYAIDQQVLAYLSLSKEIMGQVAICTMAASTWGVIEGMYTLGMRAWSVNIRIALATMKRGNDSITYYVSKARALAGKKIDEYNSVMFALVARSDELTIGEVYS
jgi:hypothetical protein